MVVTQHFSWSTFPWPRLLFAALGFVPIAALSVALFGLVPLHLSARWIVLPAIALTIVLALRRPDWGRVALVGFLAGVIATGAYDATRLVLVWLGVWPDVIPSIGRMALLDQAASPVWGYLWRFVCNGGAMGIAYAMLPWHGTRSGMIFGTAVCLCLFATLLLAPGAQERMFPLTAATAIAALIGHLDYGLVLGYLTKTWLQRHPPA